MYLVRIGGKKIVGEKRFLYNTCVCIDQLTNNKIETTKQPGEGDL